MTEFGALAEKLIRQLTPAGGLASEPETFMAATSWVLAPVPSHEYFTERMSSGSSVGVTTSSPLATSCLKSVTCAPAWPPTSAAYGYGPDCVGGAGPGDGTLPLFA